MAEMADRGNGGGDNQGFPSVPAQDKGSRNKRKLLDVPTNLPPSSRTEFHRYDSSLPPSEKSRNTPTDLLSLDLGSNPPKENPETEEFQLSDWNDPIVFQLEELLLSNLYAIFRSAIKKIAAFGYSEDVAEKAVSRGGLYCGSKDPVSNIVDDTLTFLTIGKEIDPARDNVFEDLRNLVEYTMLEMICVLREVKPSLTVVEAMWSLLICDMNISQACAMEGDLLSGFSSKEVSGESSSDSTTLPGLKSEAQSFETIRPNPNKPNILKPSLPNAQNSHSETPTFGWIPNLPNPKNPPVLEGQTPEKESLVSVSESVEKSLGNNTWECVQTTSQASAPKERTGGGRKGHSGKSKRELKLWQKSPHVEKNYWAIGPNGVVRTAKLSSYGGLDRLKFPPDFSGVNMKNASSNISTAVGVNASLPNGSNHLSSNDPVLLVKDIPTTLPTKDTASALPAAKSEISTSLPLEKKTTPTPEASIPKSPKTPNYYGGIPYDKSSGKYVPQDEKDEIIIKLVPRLQRLQNEVQGWTEWANQKVMQAARRLSKDRAELKTMRQEKEEAEQFKKEKQILEENTMKRLSEMDYALGNASGQVARANYTARKLEVENSVLKKNWEAVKLRATESAARCQEALEREQEALKKAQSWERQKGLFQEELANEKLKVAELQPEVEKAKVFQNQIEDRWKQERMAKEKLLMQAASIRKERERFEARAKAEEDKIKRKAENDMHKYVEDIKELDNKVSELRFKSESSRIAALRRGIDGSYGSCLTDSKSDPDLKENQTLNAPKRLAVFRDLVAGGLRQERECVMCLSEEMSVVFLPCAHQVVCEKCNGLHEKQGMKECPSCRTPIQQRISVRYAHP